MKNIRIFSLVIAIIFMVVSIAADIAFYFTHKPDDILADEIAVSNGNEPTGKRLCPASMVPGLKNLRKTDLF